jgi:hypothetical protein
MIQLDKPNLATFNIGPSTKTADCHTKTIGQFALIAQCARGF